MNKLPPQDLANIYLQLARLEKAGMPIINALKLLTTGEHSGSLAEILLHYAKLESEDIALHDKMLASWIPRIVYAFVVMWIVYGIFSSGVPMSSIPDDI